MYPSVFFWIGNVHEEKSHATKERGDFRVDGAGSREHEVRSDPELIVF